MYSHSPAHKTHTQKAHFLPLSLFHSIFCKGQMKHAGGIVALVWASLLPVGAAFTAARTFVMTAGPVQPSALPANANLGTSAAMSASGKRFVIGASGVGNNAGAWYAYTMGKSINKTNTAWTQIQGPITGKANEYLGYSIALSGSGNVAVVGAPGTASHPAPGAAYVYTWSQASKQFSTTPQALAPLVSLPNYSFFGFCLAISSNGKVIAVSQASPRAVYIFTASGNGFVLTQIIPGGGGELFGGALALSKTGEILVVGAASTNFLNTAQGRVYTYRRGKGASAWTQLGTFITHPSTTGYWSFGDSVSMSLSGKVLAVGAFQFGTNNQGSVSIWTFSKTAGWTIVQPALLPASPLLPNSLYGYELAVSASGKTILVTSDGYSTGPGLVWTFAAKTVGGAFTETGPPLGASYPSNPISDAFGFSLALSSAAKTLVVGAPNWRETGNTTYGAFYSFSARA